jgi:hypothetical protein
MNGPRKQPGGRVAFGRLVALGVAAGVYCLVTAGAPGLMMAASDMSAQARGGGGHGGGGHGGGGHGSGAHGGGGHAGGHTFHGGHAGGHFAVGGRGHFWHGYWWRYGVEACWRWTPTGYIWIC